MLLSAPKLIPAEILAKIQSNFAPFSAWKDRLQSSLSKNTTLNSVSISDYDSFGPNIGFVKLTADISYNSDGVRLPGIVLLRGNSVAILCKIIVASQNMEYVLLTKQPRIAMGHMGVLELPAGMMDDSSNFKGTAAKELEEECGIRIDASSDLIELTKPVPGQFDGLLTSPGLLDEQIRLFYLERHMSIQEISELKERLGGLREHGERIRLVLVPFEELLASTSDAKAICAWALYKHKFPTKT